MPLDLHGLDQLVDIWRVQVDHAIRDNDEVKTYVRGLEGRVDAEDAENEGVMLGTGPRHPAADLPSADDLADEVEQFLRERGDGT